MQTEFNATADKKNCFFFSVVRKVVTFDFIKFSFSGTLLAYAVFFYGTAEASEISGSILLLRRFPGGGGG